MDIPTVHPGAHGGEVIIEERRAPPFPSSATEDPFIEDDRCRYTHLLFRDEEDV